MSFPPGVAILLTIVALTASHHPALRPALRLDPECGVTL